jgi:hypothetical protein
MPPSRAGKRKIPLRFLAASHRDPSRRHRRQPGHKFGSGEDAALRRRPRIRNTVEPLDRERRKLGSARDLLDERKHFTVDNDLLIGVTRSFRSFSESLDEVRNARIFAGIHFRSACNDGQATIKVANWVLDHALLPVQ